MVETDMNSEDSPLWLTKSEKESLLNWDFYSRALSWLFPISMGRQITLLWFKDNTQYWMCDATQFSTHLYYFLWAFLLSAYLASFCWWLGQNEALLHFYLTLFSSKMFVVKMLPPTKEYEPPFSLLHYWICFLAAFMSGLLCFLQILIAWPYCDNDVVLLSLPWSVPLFAAFSF